MSVGIRDGDVGGAVDHDGRTGQRLVFFRIPYYALDVALHIIDVDVGAFEHHGLVDHFVAEQHVDRQHAVEKLLERQTRVVARYGTLGLFQKLFLIHEVHAGLLFERVDYRLGSGLVKLGVVRARRKVERHQHRHCQQKG